MSKATNRANTLTIVGETSNDDSLSTIRKLALEIGACYERMDECERIEFDANKKKQAKPDEFQKGIERLSADAKSLGEDFYKRLEFLKEAIANNEPIDAVDALIILLIAIPSITSDDWVRAAFQAKTEVERERLSKTFEEEATRNSELINAAARGLIRSLGVNPKELGLRAFWGSADCTEGHNLTERLNALRTRATTANLNFAAVTGD